MKLKKISFKIATASIDLDGAIFIVFPPISKAPRKFKYLHHRQYRMEIELWYIKI